MSGYLAGKLYYWTALLLAFVLFWVAYLVLTNMLSVEHPVRKYLLSQAAAGVFSLLKKVAVCILLAYFLGVLIFYG